MNSIGTMSTEFGNFHQQAPSTRINLHQLEASEKEQMLIGYSQQQASGNLPPQMIVNSLPYNPSQKSQQQRCIGLNSGSSKTDHQSNMENGQSNNNNNRMSSSGGAGLTSQQNVLYGSSLNPATSNGSAALQPQQRSHMLDLANLQQAAPFDSSYDIAANMLNNNGNSSHENRNHLNKRQAMTGDDVRNDVSLYSPSSSTSLLYHIYDQINLPNEQQYQQQLAASSDKKNGTILNPANLFAGQQAVGTGAYQMQLHQQQLSQVSELQKSLPFQQQHQCYSTSTTSANHQYHLQQQQQQQAFNASTLHPASYLGANPNSLMLDTVLRQHHAATLARHQRPLSSSAGSSMSGQSAANQHLASASSITYGRQPRSAKSNLANVLQASNTLNHLAIIHRAGQASSPSQLGTSLKAGGGGGLFGGSVSAASQAGRPFKRLQQRFRHLAHEYSTVAKCSILLILLAFSLMSIIKFTSLTATSTASTSSSPLQIATPNHNQLPPTQIDPLILMAPDYPRPPHNMPQAPVNSFFPETEATAPEQAQDFWKSKLLIGEFVIVSQNYSHSPAHRSVVAERVARLMDQVFLANPDIRRVYSRMEVTGIRPNKPLGIIVDCNIVLSESIAYAAQQFGIALYNSLSKSHERLADQVNYIIDKSSIRFNTVPDKDLKLVPPGYISPSVSHDLAFPVESAAPPAASQANGFEQNITPAYNGNQADGLNSVIWSEWSHWSSCVDKNGLCDSTRLHSRVRECRDQHTGDKIEASRCKQRFNLQDRELEVADCSQRCSQQQSSADSQHIMSDAPSFVPLGASGPQTAPSVMLDGNESPSALTNLNPANGPKVAAITSGGRDAALSELYQVSSPSSAAAAASVSTAKSAQQPNASTEPGSAQVMASAAGEAAVSSSSLATPTMLPPPVELQQQLDGSQMSCKNCTSDEICLLLMQQKVPFCAKVKDRADESGCGGWCKAHNQLCQPVGQNAFKCVHDSECLPDEWRCHDSGCIPLSKRCDGHYNCYDNSDEIGCS